MSGSPEAQRALSAETAPISTRAGEPLVPARAPRRHAALLVYHRDGTEVVSLRPGGSVVVGREPPADVAIHDRCLSRRHARFTLTSSDEVVVDDLGSTNGTRVAGERVERAVLRPGDEVRLGTVSVVFHVLAGVEPPLRGLEGDDALRAAVEVEVERARFFGRSFAVAVVRAVDRAEGHLARWCPRVRAALRPVDRAALYSAEALQIVLPEVHPEQAFAIGRALVERRPGEPALVCGVATFPAAASADELISEAWDAARRASPAAPVQAASSSGTRTLVSQPGAPRGELLPQIIVESASMRGVVETVTRLSRSSIPVLLQGETGTGKEMLARLLHDAGPRRAGPLVCVNCAAIPGNLVESTLFGHERGAFTGAVQQHRGVFEAASGGTVFLDEIAELTTHAQAALLRVFETKRLSRVGSTKEIEVDVRVVAATHRDLEAMCAASAFREDLYFRLSSAIIDIPPLRARREDVGPLARRFLAVAGEAGQRPMRGIDPEAMDLLAKYAWPGNVRELRNAIERAVAIADGDLITARDLPPRVRGVGASAKGARSSSRHAGTMKERLERFEAEALVEALREAGGSQTEAARRLDMPLRTLQHKIKVYGIKKSFSVPEQSSRR